MWLDRDTYNAQQAQDFANQPDPLQPAKDAIQFAQDTATQWQPAQWAQDAADFAKNTAGGLGGQDAMAVSDAAQPAPVVPEPAPPAPQQPVEQQTALPEQQAPPEQPVQPMPSHVPTQRSAPTTGVPTTADISNPVQGSGSPSMGLGDIYKIAIDQGLGEEGAKVATAIAKTEGGLTGIAGDSGKSFGPFQFYGGGGQLNNFAKEHGFADWQQAGEYVRQHPSEAAQWALRAGGYLSNAIKQGIEKGLSGSDLATYAQKNGQVSETPERAGQNYQALWAGGGTAASLPAAAVGDFLGKAGQAIGTGLGNAGQAVGDTLGNAGEAVGKAIVPSTNLADYGPSAPINAPRNIMPDLRDKTGDVLGAAGAAIGSGLGVVGNTALDVLTTNPYAPGSQIINSLRGKAPLTDEQAIQEAQNDPMAQVLYQAELKIGRTPAEAAQFALAGKAQGLAIADAPLGAGGLGKAAAPLGKAAAEAAPLPSLEDFVANRPKPARGVEAHTLPELARWLQQPVGEPGISIEGHYIPRFDMTLPDFKNVVYRDASGQPKGILSLSLDKSGQPEILEIAVDPAAQRQGVATALYDAAQQAGYDVNKATGAGGYTEEGAALAYSRLKGATAGAPPINPGLGPESIAKSLGNAATQTTEHNSRTVAVFNAYPDGTNIEGWTKITTGGDVFWQKGKRTVANLQAEIGGEKASKATGMDMYNPPPVKPPVEPPAPPMGAEPPGGMPPGAPAPSSMGKLNAAATGTAEQAAQLRPVEPGFAGNVKLAKFQPDIQPLIQQTMDENNQLAGTRRGVVTDAAAKAGAVDAAKNTSIEAILGKAKPGKAYTQEEVLVLGDTITRTGNEYNALNTTYQAALKAGTDTPAMKIGLAQKALQTSALIATRAGAAAEAGRSLRAFTEALTGEAGAQGAAIQKAFKLLGGGDAFDKWLAEFNAIPPENLAAQYNMMQGLAKPTIWDKLNYLRYNSMLSSYKTHMNNMASQAGTALNPALELAASGHPGEAGTYLRTLTQGIPDAIAGSVDLLRQGATPEQMLKMDVGRPNPFGTGKVGRVMGAPTDFLGAEDHFFQSISYGAQLRLQAERLGKTPAEVQELMANPTDVMTVRAKDAAQRSTYTENPGEFVTGLMDWTNTHGPGGAALKFLVPFVRVPANIFHRGISMTLQPVTGPVKVALNLAKGNTEAAKLEAGRTAIAGTFGLGFAALAVNGRLTGAGPVDPARRKLLETSGWQSHSLDVSLPGSKPRWIDYTNFGTISVPMATIAAAWEGAQDAQQKPKTELAADVTSRIAKILIDTSYIKGIGQIFQIASTGAGAIPAFVSNIANTLIPYGGLGAAVERIVDPATRATDVPGASIASRLPGLSGMLPAQVDPYGRPQTTGEGDTLAQIALPWRTSTERPDPVAKEVARLISLGQSVPVRTFGEQYAGAKQTPEQQRLIQTQAGQMAATYLADYIARPEYAKATDAEKAKTLTNAMGTAYQLADLKLGDQVARDPKYLALQSWANVPHYETVKGTPEQIRVRNFEIAQAYAKLAEYRKQYGTDLGEVRLLKADPGAWKLTQLSLLDSDYLAAKKKVIDKMFGGALTQATQEGLIGAGNTVLTPAGAK